MHLLVLSAFRPKSGFDDTSTLTGLNAPFGAQCFPTRQQLRWTPWPSSSQCTFWCSVLSDLEEHAIRYAKARSVSMHLLVLSAFRQNSTESHRSHTPSLNAPFGAQCFPTGFLGFWGGFLFCLNAPFGAQCFPTMNTVDYLSSAEGVSMHLLVLSAFRRTTK